jgi:hypothetical protein
VKFFHQQRRCFILLLIKFLDEEEPDASTHFQAFEDVLKDNISSRYIYYNKEAYSKMILQL